MVSPLFKPCLKPCSKSERSQKAVTSVEVQKSPRHGHKRGVLGYTAAHSTLILLGHSALHFRRCAESTLAALRRQLQAALFGSSLAEADVWGLFKGLGKQVSDLEFSEFGIDLQLITECREILGLKRFG